MGNVVAQGEHKKPYKLLEGKCKCENAKIASSRLVTSVSRQSCSWLRIIKCFCWKIVLVGNTNVLQREACFTTGKIKQKQGSNFFFLNKKVFVKITFGNLFFFLFLISDKWDWNRNECVMVDDYSFLFSYWYIKIHFGMNQDWESKFQISYQKIVSWELWLPCCSAKLASCLTCSFALSFAGWDKHSYGYHGDDGHSFCSSGTGQPYGPTFTTGDVIGCCVNLINNTCFYTKNGHSLGK